jgi:hypothetical protein
VRYVVGEVVENRISVPQRTTAHIAQVGEPWLNARNSLDVLAKLVGRRLQQRAV